MNRAAMITAAIFVAGPAFAQQGFSRNKNPASPPPVVANPVARDIGGRQTGPVRVLQYMSIRTPIAREAESPVTSAFNRCGVCAAGGT